MCWALQQVCSWLVCNHRTTGSTIHTMEIAKALLSAAIIIIISNSKAFRIMMQCCLKHAKHLAVGHLFMTCLRHVLRRPAARLLQSSHELSRSRSDSSGMWPRLALKPLPHCHPRCGLTGADSADDCIQAWGQPAAHLLEHPTQVSIALPLHWLCCTVKVFSVLQVQQKHASHVSSSS